MESPYHIDHYEDIRVIGARDLISEPANRAITQAARKLVQQGHYYLVADLSEVSVMNSVGLNFLIKLRTQLHQHGGELVVCHAAPRVQQLLEMTKLDTIMVCTPTRDEALAHLRGLMTHN